MRLRLSPKDRENLGGSEWLDVDVNRLTTREAEALEEAAGVNPGAFITDLNGGNPKTRTVRALVWLGLYRAGVNLPFDECHFDIAVMGTVEDPGKAPSATSGSSTRGRSAPVSRSKSSPRKR